MIRKYSKWIIGLILLAFAAPFLLQLLPQNDPQNNGGEVTEKPLPPLTNVNFSADSAYRFTEKLLTFGPRNMGAKGHETAKKWLISTFKQYGATVTEQNFKDKAYTGLAFDGTNIIAQFRPENPNRVMLAAHWDSRHIADQDQNRQQEPILGADDSGSAVGMLLEIARQLQADSSLKLGVDIVLFDAEDMGEASSDNGWCLGSKYWASQAVNMTNKPKYGILLDMAGSRNARFMKETISLKYAPTATDNVWRVAKQLGYGNYFKDETGSEMIDDHKYVNEIAKIPMLDIINTKEGGGFGDFWHTHQDDTMEHIDKNTLQAVGKTVYSVLKYEQDGVL